jgi:hypothetical protein
MYFLAMIWEDAELLQLRQFDTFMESAPQLLLGLYIAIKEESLFGCKYFLDSICNGCRKKKNVISFYRLVVIENRHYRQLVVGITLVR